MYQDQLEVIFNDSRIREVRLRLQSNPFEVFMKNYMESQHYKIGYRTQGVLDVKCPTKRVTNYVTYDYKCDCFGQERTGIPCCHLLCAAKSDTIPYIKLINPRWLVDPDEPALG
jgi:hypothetical protein